MTAALNRAEKMTKAELEIVRGVAAPASLSQHDWGSNLVHWLGASYEQGDCGRPVSKEPNIPKSYKIYNAM